MTRAIYTIPLLSVLAFTAACSSSSDSKNKAKEKSSAPIIASVKGGDFQLTDAGQSYSDFSGYAHLVIDSESSSIEVYAKGLSSDTEYNAHVHNGWCASGGGGHYLQDDSGEDEAANGLWPKVTVNSEGIGMGYASNNFVVTDDAKSVVIHEAGGSERIACVDLRSSSGLSGNFAITEAGKDIYESIEGKAFVSVKGNTSKAEVAIIGLTADETYKTHVHVGDCESGGGGHYLDDASIEGEASNELWPTPTVNTNGYAFGWASSEFKARLDETKSIVVHDVDDSSIRVACADLAWELLAFRSGRFWMTSEGEALYGEGNIDGRARLSITKSGVSTASVYFSGLTPDVYYKSHVHSGTCESGGGKHYWQDMDSENDVADNGLFPYFTTDGEGVGMIEVSNDFIVRPDARSVVLHEPEGGARIACADLR